MPTLIEHQQKIAELLSAEDMIEALIKQGVRREVAERIAASSGIAASKSLRK